MKYLSLGIYNNKQLFTYLQDQSRGDPIECDDGCDGPPPNFQVVKTEVVNDSEIGTVTDVTGSDELENTDALKNDSENFHFGDLIDTTT